MDMTFLISLIWGHLSLVSPEASTIWNALSMENNTKLFMKMDSYLECKNKSQQISGVWELQVSFFRDPLKITRNAY